MSDLLTEHLGRLWQCSRGKSHAVSLRAASVEEGLLSRLPALLALPPVAASSFTLVADVRTYAAAGERLCQVLRQAGASVDFLSLEEPHAEEEEVEALKEKLRSLPGFVLAVGSGTINDLCKSACHRLGRPYAVVATAPSMNGYASSIAALERRGVKRTDPVHPPVAVYGDIEVLAAAPAAMRAAGVGDLLGKAVADRDWALASALTGDDAWCPCAASMVDAAELRLRACIAGGAPGSDRAIAVLTEGLVLSGMAMEASGSSSPASGGEHLVSHFLDLMAPHQGRLPSLHGRQVALGTLLSLELYHALLPCSGEELFGKGLAERAVRRTRELLAEARERLSFLPELLHGELRCEGEAKIRLWESLGEESGQRLARFWDRHRRTWADELPTAEAHFDLLRQAEAAPDRSCGGGTRESLGNALRYGLLCRRRLTILDLASSTGLLSARSGDLVERWWLRLAEAGEGRRA